jgi:hypothetical protein
MLRCGSRLSLFTTAPRLELTLSRFWQMRLRSLTRSSGTFRRSDERMSNCLEGFVWLTLYSCDIIITSLGSDEAVLEVFKELFAGEEVRALER